MSDSGLRSNSSKEKRDVDVCPNSVGTCVVFNCMTFQNEGRHDKYLTRNGTECDGKTIKETFKGFLFDVITVNDPTEKEFAEEIQLMSTGHISPYIDLKNKKFFICFILSHGEDSDRILTSDKISINVKDAVLDKLHTITALQGKNKIIVLQSCRGGKVDEGETEGSQMNLQQLVSMFDQVKPITSHPHFCVIFATTPGYVAYRNMSGTTFIHTFCEILKEHRSDLCLSELVRRLIFLISCIPVMLDSKYVLQIPNVLSTLRSPMFFHHANNIKDKTKENYEMNDKHVNEQITKIIRTLFKIAGRRIALLRCPVIQDRDFLLLVKQKTGPYDTACVNGMIRYCLVIDITSRTVTNKAAKDDSKTILKSMQSLKFKSTKVDSSILFIDNKNSKQRKEINIVKCMPHCKKICCFFCFIQFDEDQYEIDDQILSEIICQLKCQTALLGKPKVFVFQPYKAHNQTMVDGNRNTNEHQVKISKESDLLIINSASSDELCPTLTTMFCKTLKANADNYSIIDLLEDVLPKEWGRYFEDANPSFSSTMRKPLTINRDGTCNNFEKTTTNNEHRKELAVFNEKIKSVIKDCSPSGSGLTKTDTDTNQHKRNKEHDQETPWKKINKKNCFMLIAVHVLLVIINLTGIVYDDIWYLMTHDCNDDENLPITNAWTCEEKSDRLKLINIYFVGFIYSILIVVACTFLLICVWRPIFYKKYLKKQLFLCRVIEAFLFTFNLISCILGMAGLIVQKEYDIKIKFEFSSCIVVMTASVFVWMKIVSFYHLFLTKDIKPRQTQVTAWRNITLEWCRLMVPVNVVLVILHSTGLGLHVKGYLQDQDCNRGESTGIACDDGSHRLTALVFDIAGVIISLLITIASLFVLINVRRNRFYQNSEDKRYRSYRVNAVLLSAFSLFTVILGVVPLILRSERRLKDEFYFLLSIGLLSLFAFGFMHISTVMAMPCFAKKKETSDGNDKDCLYN